MDLAKSLRIVLAQRGMQQKDLAEQVGVSKQIVSLWTNTGNISRVNLELICKTFEMNVSEFVALGEDQ